MFDGRWRAGVDRRTEPLAVVVRKLGLTANELTVLGLLLAVASATLIALGIIGAGVVVGGAAAMMDLLDGPVAKISGTRSQQGALLDSVADRVTDAVFLLGIAWYVGSTEGSGAAMIVLGILASSNLVSYERAKAESLGLVAKGGLMERAERLIGLGLALVIRPLMVPLLVAVLALTLVTAAVRFRRVWSQAAPGASPPVPVPEAARAARPAWGPGRVDSRWRAWRERAVLRSSRARGSGAPLGRWRARRQAVVASRASRSGRLRRGSPSSPGRGEGDHDGPARRRVTETLRRRFDGAS